ncbi:hypothetical protein FEF09_24885 [Chitinophaga pinensis]|uniref:Flavodoxin-like fold domain-containing protein n=1 Tax=Chitinophaga pinensis TaxID=79329 RepID=A0A5C6LLD7_9BACT|nr:hypothetical protein FEF09_24885 [Chitinophaga pinensis]
MIAALAESEALVDRLHDADIYVIGMPMYNFSVPSYFKVFIDNIVRINRTFHKHEGQYEGLLKNKKVLSSIPEVQTFQQDLCWNNPWTSCNPISKGYSLSSDCMIFISSMYILCSSPVRKPEPLPSKMPERNN